MKNLKTLIWHGKATEVECKDHHYAWSGKMPCAGMYNCVFCGQPEADTFDGKKPVVINLSVKLII